MEVSQPFLTWPLLMMLAPWSGGRPRLFKGDLPRTLPLLVEGGLPGPIPLLGGLPGPLLIGDLEPLLVRLPCLPGPLFFIGGLPGPLLMEPWLLLCFFPHLQLLKKVQQMQKYSECNFETLTLGTSWKKSSSRILFWVWQVICIRFILWRLVRSTIWLPITSIQWLSIRFILWMPIISTLLMPFRCSLWLPTRATMWLPTRSILWSLIQSC